MSRPAHYCARCRERAQARPSKRYGQPIAGLCWGCTDQLRQAEGPELSPGDLETECEAYLAQVGPERAQRLRELFRQVEDAEAYCAGKLSLTARRLLRDLREGGAA